jgi:SHS2 domain-containing protein
LYETFEHTADLGLRARASGLDTLFVETAHALFSAIVDNPDQVEARERVEFQLKAEDLELLLFDWLNELLYWFDAGHMLFGRFEIRIKDLSLTATAWGEPLDRERHLLQHEVKAITYHGLRVEPQGEEWLAEVIVDI